MPDSEPRSDKRRVERTTILGDLQGEVMVFEPIAVAEISQHGARIETTFPLQLDSLHDLRLTLGDRSVVVKGRIVHSAVIDVDQDSMVYRSGIEFVEPSPHVEAVIIEFVEAIRTGRRSL